MLWLWVIITGFLGRTEDEIMTRLMAISIARVLELGLALRNR